MIGTGERMGLIGYIQNIDSLVLDILCFEIHERYPSGDT